MPTADVIICRTRGKTAAEHKDTKKTENRKERRSHTQMDKWTEAPKVFHLTVELVGLLRSVGRNET